jgi:electron transfer flavoprotein alpha subunit
MDRPIIVIAEHFENELRPITNEVVALALELQLIRHEEIRLVILGDDIVGIGEKTSRETGLNVIAIEVPGLGSYSGEVYKSVLSKGLSDLNPSYICMAHTTQGADLAPQLAVRMEAACITGVLGVLEEKGRPSFTRGMYNGKVIAGLQATVERTVLTIQPGSLKPPTFDHSKPGSVETCTMASPTTTRSLPRGIKPPTMQNAGLTEAEVIISAGRGLRKKENLGLIHDLSALWPGSAVGGSRPVCDSGWLEYGQQVGVTGATVTPRLYVACGISGASQHIVGMSGSGFIVAINRDPYAAIFNVADVCVIEDLITFIPRLIDEYKKMSITRHKGE